MKKKPMAGLAIGLCMSGIGGSANATFLTFDDIGPPGEEKVLPANYGDFIWDQMGYLNGTPAAGGIEGYVNGRVSGEYVAYNLAANVASVSVNIGTFDFVGAYLTAAYNDGLQVEVTGLLDGTQSYRTTVPVLYDAPTWYDFNFEGIDTLKFRSFGGTDHDGDPRGWGETFVMDNFTFNKTAPVPEPTTMLLIGSGLAGLVGSRFGKWKKYK